MTPPTSYTDEAFTQYLAGQATQAGLAQVLGWSINANSYDEVVTDTLLVLNKTSCGDVQSTQIRALRAVGRFHLWKALLQALTLFYSYSSAGSSFQRREAMENLRRLMDDARNEAIGLGVSDTVLSPVPPVTHAAAQFEVINDTDEWA